MDAVAEFYSGPQSGGSLKVQPYRKGYGPRYAIPLKRGGRGQEYVGKAAGGIAEAVKMAGSAAAVNTFQRDSSKNDGERKYRGKTGASQQRFVKNSASGLITRTQDQDDNGKPNKKKPNTKKSVKHKRSKIDELLGDDSY